MKHVIDYLAEEEKQEQAERLGRVKMTEQQRLEYKLYRAACLLSNVEPVRADFLSGDIPWCVIHDMELELNENELERREVAQAKAFAAHA
jgi:hypothetical protein